MCVCVSWCACYIKGRSLRWSPRWGDAVCGGWVQEGAVVLAPLSAGFQSLPPLPTSKLGPSGANSWVGGFVYILGDPVGLSNKLSWDWEFLLLLPQPPQVFSVRGFEALLPHAGALRCAICLAPQFIFLVYHMWDHLLRQPPPRWVHQPPSCHTSSPHPSYRSG